MPERKRHGAASVRRQIEKSAETIRFLLTVVPRIEAIRREVVAALTAGHKVLTAGNGGSAAEAIHAAEELVGRFRNNRASLPAVCLACDAAALTCIGNDFGFDRIFSRQVEGLAQTGDVLILFSTSGNAANLSRALEAARRRGTRVVCLLGRDGGRLAGRGDHEIVVPGTATERIQEAHLLLIHLILDAVERAFPPVPDAPRS